MKTTSISLGGHFDKFVEAQVLAGRYLNAEEVICAGLRLLEEEDQKVAALKEAIQAGLDSPRVEHFDFEENLLALKAAQ